MKKQKKYEKKKKTLQSNMTPPRVQNSILTDFNDGETYGILDEEFKRKMTRMFSKFKEDTNKHLN
jgi:hypothetical protein